MRLNENQLLAIMITDDGKIHNKIMKLPVTLSDLNLAEVEAVLQERLLGLSLAQVADSLTMEIARHLLQQQSRLQQALALLQELLLDYSRTDQDSSLLIQAR